MNTCLFIYKDRNKFTDEIGVYLDKVGIKLVVDASEADFTVLLGGDGTLLGASRSGVSSPVVAINTGHLGFMTTSTQEQAFSTIDRVLRGDFTVTTRHLLHTQIGFEDAIDQQSIHSYLALNDVVIRPRASNNRNLSKLISMVLYAKDQREEEQLVTTYRADGLIVASPTGSTAYSLSAGGPIIHPSCRSFVVTPIAPQGLTQRPLVLPYTMCLKIEPLDDDLYLSADGQVGESIEKGDMVWIRYNSHSIQTVDPLYTYYESLQMKLGWTIFGR